MFSVYDSLVSLDPIRSLIDLLSYSLSPTIALEHLGGPPASRRVMVEWTPNSRRVTMRVLVAITLQRMMVRVSIVLIL